MNCSDFIEFVIVNKLQYDYSSKKLIVSGIPRINQISDKINFIYTHSSRRVSIDLDNIDKFYSFSFEEFFQLNKDIKVMDETQFILAYDRGLWILSTPLPTEIKIEIEKHESKTV